MSSTLSQDLVKTPQREIAGSRTSKLFSYQKNWALAELIEYHLADKDYVFAFEFHDDILIFDSETSPSNLKFVQVKVKTNGAKWTIKQLIKSEKGKNGNPDKLSIIGKLYENKFNFNTHTSELSFVTNAYFSFTNSGLSSCANTLDIKDQNEITVAIQNQINSTNPIDLNSLFFERSSLSFDDHENHIRGKLHTFFESLFGNSHNIAVSPWYQSISDQIKKKNDFPSDQIKSFDDLIRNKCITKAEIDKFIQRVSQSHNTADNWDILKIQLSTEGYDYKKLIKLQTSWRKYSTDRLDYGNSALKSFEKKVFSELHKYQSSSLREKIESVKNKLKSEISNLKYIYDDDYITCIIIWIDCE